MAHAYGRHYAHASQHYGYNPGAAVAAGVIGSIIGAGIAGAGYPYSCDVYSYGLYNGCSGYADWGGDYGPYYGGLGYGYGGAASAMVMAVV